jgi:hypothetical protein
MYQDVFNSQITFQQFGFYGMGDGVALSDAEETIDLDMNVNEIIKSHFSDVTLLHFPNHQILTSEVSHAPDYFFGGGGVHDFIDGGS